MNQAPKPGPAGIIDAHNHLQDSLLSPHREAVLRDLRAAGVVRAVVNGTTEADWTGVAALAREHPWIIPSYGLHPWHLASRTPQWQSRLLARLEKAGPGRAAIGEIGLDRWKPGYDFDDQKAVFLWQFGLAAQRDLPATVHCLKAWGALAEIVRERPVPPRGFLLHAYGGPVEMVDGFARRGAYFSFSGHFLHARKTAAREAFREIPADRLLVETDAPAMPLPLERVRFPLPETAAGDPQDPPLNHPANIVAVYEGLAELRGWSLERLTTQIAENFRRLFGDF